jgi:hypothetical protein
LKTFLNTFATLLLILVVFAGSFAVWIIPKWSAAGHLGLQCAIIIVVAIALYMVAEDIKE